MYAKHNIKILEYSPFHISKFKFCELSIDGQRKKILDGLFFYKYTLIKQWGSNILGIIYKTDWSWNKESPTEPSCHAQAVPA